MRYDAVIFDMDGTLVDSEVVWEVVEGEMFESRGKAYTADIRAQVLGLRLDEFFERLIAIYDLDETVEALTEELNERVLTRIREGAMLPKPGAQAIIDYVGELGLPYCIASSSPQVIIDGIVASRGWSDVIPQRYSADLVALGKPAPDVYLYAAEQLGVAPERCLAIEDSATGARSAVAAGMTCFVVPDYHTNPQAFEGITPHVFPDLHAVLAHLKDA